MENNNTYSIIDEYIKSLYKGDNSKEVRELKEELREHLILSANELSSKGYDDEKWSQIAKLLGGSVDDLSFREDKKYSKFNKKLKQGEYGYLAEQDPELFSRIVDREFAKKKLGFCLYFVG